MGFITSAIADSTLAGQGSTGDPDFMDFISLNDRSIEITGNCIREETKFTAPLGRSFFVTEATGCDSNESLIFLILSLKKEAIILVHSLVEANGRLIAAGEELFFNNIKKFLTFVSSLVDFVGEEKFLAFANLPIVRLWAALKIILSWAIYLVLHILSNCLQALLLFLKASVYQRAEARFSLAGLKVGGAISEVLVSSHCSKECTSLSRFPQLGIGWDSGALWIASGVIRLNGLKLLARLFSCRLGLLSSLGILKCIKQWSDQVRGRGASTSIDLEEKIWHYKCINSRLSRVQVTSVCSMYSIVLSKHSHWLHLTPTNWLLLALWNY